MPRKNPKTEHITNNEVIKVPLDAWWAGFDDYKLESDGMDGKRELVRGVGAKTNKYRLDLANIHEQLLRDYCRIKVTTGALTWVQQWGFPVPAISNCLYIDQILASAASTQWIENLREAISDARNGNFEELNGCLIRRRIAAGSIAQLKQGLEESLSLRGMDTQRQSEYDIELMCANRQLSFDEQLHHYVSDWLPGKLETDRYVVTFAPSSLNVPNWTRLFGGCSEHLGFTFENPMFLYDAQTWDADEETHILFAAQSYIQQAFQSLLAGVQPRLEWYHDQSWHLVPCFSVRYPWQAINLALYHRYCHTNSLRSCERPGCRELIIGRKGKRFHNDACRMWCKRNLP